jgi:hypothetical protein
MQTDLDSELRNKMSSEGCFFIIFFIKMFFFRIRKCLLCLQLQEIALIVMRKRDCSSPRDEERKRERARGKTVLIKMDHGNQERKIEEESEQEEDGK